MEEKLDLLFDEIKNECLNIIKEKNVDIEELSTSLGCDVNSLLKLLKERDADFSVYLKLYDILTDWQVENETN